MKIIPLSFLSSFNNFILVKGLDMKNIRAVFHLYTSSTQPQEHIS